MKLPGGLSVTEFLQEYWQKKPKVIRQAFPGFQSPVSAEELAGLACEEAVESRIVIEDDGGKPWQLHNGPFPPDRFSHLPESHWTLLVQGLDHWVPDVADLLNHFRFIPNWRLDDIMASYAPVGGSVGPHFDQYDVFLLQAEGQRTWHFGGRCDETSPRVEGTPLRILKDWAPEETVTLNPGDMLYLPPGIGHHGIADNDCITLSIGFRAPTVDDLLTGFTDFLSSQHDASVPLSNLQLDEQSNPGAISPDIIDQLDHKIRETMADKRLLALWFGQYATAPKNLDIVVPAEETVSEDDVEQMIAEGAQIRWNEGSRFAYHELEDTTALFVDGEQYLLRGDATPLAQLLCAGTEPDMTELAALASDDAIKGLLCRLVNQGSLYFE
ncbi:cupin domain-containing protein [Marinobacter sp. CHS3-4]|uniref:ribosomal protein uL16 3-hydroxylase n=1 Tax=Marinobacter sp. CHS3-4 TaxID=3045174 RepID=UPI0024B54EAE|nr:cupin domain-containing protein [Marinobacter sp. CHS3-4]MDI9245698.1 cupin domain-containing protein [Marinobacter sp. CHS3-4]